MLKLLKYEWKACARICLPLYAVELLVAFINRLLYSDIGSKLLYGIPSIVMTMLYAAIMVALFVVTAVVLVQRFYKNLLGSEGYLMFTLPVSVSQHILCINPHGNRELRLGKRNRHYTCVSGCVYCDAE